MFRIDCIKNNKVIRFIYYKLLDIMRHHRKIKIINNGTGKINKYIINGEQCTISIGHGTSLNHLFVRINGSNNTIIIDENCVIGPKCSFWLEGDNNTIHIGSNTTFTKSIHLCVQENDMSIMIGNDCMFSNNIIIRTSDSHPIYDKNTKQRINHPQSVIIGNHVWIAPDSKIMKGVEIGDNSIIGSNTFVTKNTGENVLAVGIPAKEIKNEIFWTRESLF